MPPPVPFSNLVQAVTQSSLVQTILALLTQLNFPVTSWRSGDPSNTIVQASATALSQFSASAATQIAGGFLDYAAQPSVTPDPSVIPGAPPGWLDALASSVYNVVDASGNPGRIKATAANGQLTFVNTSGNTYGPFQPLSFHVSNPTSGATYSNSLALSIPPGTSSAPFAADVAGAGGTSGVGTITFLITAQLGVTCSNLTVFVGSNAESNTALVARCRAKLGALSPNGPRQAYDYFARTIPPPAPLVALTSGALTTPKNPVTRTKIVVALGTGAVSIYVASANGPYVAPDLYVNSASLPITSVTNTAPPVLTVAAHGYTTLDNVYLTGTGLPILDGQTFPITVTGANTFTVPTLAPGVSATGFAYRQSDLDLINKTEQTYAVPVAIGTVTTQTAPGNIIRITATLTLRRGSTLTAGQAASLASSALAVYFASLPLGGDNSGGGSFFFFLEPMGAAIVAAAPVDIINVAFGAPGATADVPVITPQDVAVLSPASSFAVVNEV